MSWQIVNVIRRDDGGLEDELVQKTTLLLSEDEWCVKSGAGRRRRPRAEILAALAAKLRGRGER